MTKLYYASPHERAGLFDGALGFGGAKLLRPQPLHVMQLWASGRRIRLYYDVANHIIYLFIVLSFYLSTRHMIELCGVLGHGSEGNPVGVVGEVEEGDGQE